MKPGWFAALAGIPTTLWRPGPIMKFQGQRTTSQADEEILVTTTEVGFTEVGLQR